MVGAEDGAEDGLGHAVERGEIGAVEESGSRAAALQSHVHHRNIQIDSGRGYARGVAVHFCAVDWVQFAVHLVRYGLRVSRRNEVECRGCAGACG